MEGILDLLAYAGRFLPITVVVAIVLFVVKEGLEANRRRKANARDLFAYIEGFYNSRRLHSAIGYRSPADMERMAA